MGFGGEAGVVGGEGEGGGVEEFSLGEGGVGGVGAHEEEEGFGTIGGLGFDEVEGGGGEGTGAEAEENDGAFIGKDLGESIPAGGGGFGGDGRALAEGFGAVLGGPGGG